MPLVVDTSDYPEGITRHFVVFQPKGQEQGLLLGRPFLARDGEDALTQFHREIRQILPDGQEVEVCGVVQTESLCHAICAVKGEQEVTP